jgi:hypothetical protein
MRKAIFKREMESCFQYSKKISEKQKMDILEALFENPIDVTKIYLLKKEFNSTQDVSNYIKRKSIINDKKFIAEVCSLFEVTDDMELPDSLREQLARKEKIAIFTGAGVSKIIGIPLWEELACKAIDYLHKKNLINFSESDEIKNENISPKQKLSIFHDILPKNNSKDFYQAYFNIKSEYVSRNPYDILVTLDIPKFSSNLDDEFWNALQRNRIQNEAKVKPIQIASGFKEEMAGNINTNTIYQIHGSYQQLERYSIITMRDYLDWYFLNDGLHKFLENIFHNYVVIFIGYGLEEFELLHNIIKGSKNHHVLIGTYLGDSNLLRIRKEYFRKTLSMHAHGYYLDFKGYERLYEVIDSWVKKIIFEQTGDFYQKTTGEFRDVKL